MKQVFNWTIGSFFRTIGRTIAFLVMGGLIYYILSSNGFEFGIRDLFFDKVDALTYTQDIKLRNNNWLTVTNTSDWVDSYPYYMKTINSQSSASMQQYLLNFDSATENYVANYDLIAIDFTASMTVRNLQTNAIKDWECLEWLETDFGTSQYNGYECKWWSYETEHNDIPYVIGRDTLNFDFIINYSGSWENNWSSCNLVNGTVYCPTYKRTVKNIEIRVNFVTVETTRMTMGILRGYKVFDYDNTANAINSQTQQQQQQHEEVMDSNTTEAEEEASSFFEDFDAPDIGGLGAIITAPLNTIRSLLNSSCTNLVLPLPFVNENITLPCMNTIYTQHFGAFFTIYQTIILAIIAYRCIRSIFFDIHGFTNPNDDRIEVMDL